MDPMDFVVYVSVLFVVPALILPFMSSILGKGRRHGPLIVIFGVTLCGLMLMATIMPTLSETIAEPKGPFVLDWFGVIIAVAAMLSVLIVALGLDVKDGGEIFSSMMLFSLTGTVLLCLAADVSVIIAGWALISVTGYALAAVMKDPNSLRNSIKYAIMGGIAAQFLVIAFLFLFMTTGNFSLLPEIGSPFFLLASLIFLLVAVGFKTGVAPFHMWLPDVYGYADPIAVAALSSVTKLGAIAVIVRATYYYLSSSGIQHAQVVVAAMALVATISMFVGNLGALTQRNVQRMMAYSSIAHMGYILIALAVIPVALYVGEESSLYMAIAGVMLHVIAYALAKAGIFTSIDMLSDPRRGPLIERFDGLGARNPASAAAISILLLNFIGVPPLPGFWSKLLLFASAANSNLPGLVVSGIPWLTLVGILNSVISVFYYAKVMIAMYWKPSKITERYAVLTRVAMAFSAVLLIAIGIFVAPLLASIIM